MSNTLSSPALIDAARLRAELSRKIRVARSGYQAANHLIASNLAKGTPRRGKWKLALALDELAHHMRKREERASLQQQLRVLVPLERRIRILLEQGDSFLPGASRGDLVMKAGRAVVPQSQALYSKLRGLTLRALSDEELETLKQVFDSYRGF